MAKKFATMGLTLCMVLLMGLSCFAATPEIRLVSTTEKTLPNGVVCVTSIYEEVSWERSNTKKGGVAQDYYDSNWNKIANVVLNATFSYDGIEAMAIRASGSHAVASGWSYWGESTWCGGDTAYLSAAISGGGEDIWVDLSLTCLPDGTLL